jgi:hypothetical protein
VFLWNRKRYFMALSMDRLIELDEVLSVAPGAESWNEFSKKAAAGRVSGRSKVDRVTIGMRTSIGQFRALIERLETDRQVRAFHERRSRPFPNSTTTRASGCSVLTHP